LREKVLDSIAKEEKINKWARTERGWYSGMLAIGVLTGSNKLEFGAVGWNH
jgi:hypothetical protein